MKYSMTLLSMLGWAQLFGQTVVQAQTSSCSTSMNEFCEREGNRFCYVDEETEKETCGTCLPTYVEWNARCLFKDYVDIALFLSEYSPHYLEDITSAERAQLLLSVIQTIVDYNSQNPPPPFQLGLNPFSADTETELATLRGFDRSRSILSNITFNRTFASEEVLPEKVDWVELGAVTSIKDQGRCGSCWAMATAGVLEGASAIQNDFLQSLSPQQMISCDENNFGCDGGSLVWAMAYPIYYADGISRLVDYPYTDADGTTTTTCNSRAPVAVSLTRASYVVDFDDDFSFDERLQLMKEAVAKQPVAIVLKSACQIFTSYSEGILTEDGECACEDTMCADHAVLLVGYDDTSSPPSWLIKNSWGSRWGENGYVRISQEESGPYGLFGMLLHGVVPDLDSSLTNGGVTPSEPLDTDDDDEWEWWAWLLLLLGAMLVIYFILTCFFGALCPCGRKK